MMHVMTKYLDTRKAAISTLEDYPLMEQATSQDTQAEANQLREDLARPTSPKITGMPRSRDPHAGERRKLPPSTRLICSQPVAKKPKSTWTGSCPPGKHSTPMTSSCWKTSSSAKAIKTNESK